MSSGSEFDVVVVGGGIGGLVTAVLLQRAGVRTLLIERGNLVGGLLTRTRLGDLEVDAGGESFATRNDAVRELIGELGIDLAVVAPNPNGAMLASSERGRVRRAPLPTGTVLGIPGRPWAREVRRVIGVAGALRASLDLLLPAGIGGNTTSLGDLVERRMGRRVRTRLVDCVCRSVYSTPANELDVDRVSPALAAELLRGGSLARAVRAVASGARPGSAVETLVGGMWRLPLELASVFQAHGGVLWTAASAVDITRTHATQLEVTVAVRNVVEHVRARQVVLAVAGPAAATLLAGVDPELSGMLGAASFRGVTVACARLGSTALDSHPVGNGVIVAQGVASRAKALTHLNAKWAWLGGRLGAHEHIVRLSFDGTSPETAAFAADRDAIAAELSLLTGVPIGGAEISELTVLPWPDAVVPLAAGPGPSLRAASLAAELRGVTCVGSWVAGTGLAAVIPQARAAAGRVIRSHQTESTVARKGNRE